MKVYLLIGLCVSVIFSTYYRMNELTKRILIFTGLYMILASISYLTMSVFQSNMHVNCWSGPSKGVLAMLFTICAFISFMVSGPLTEFKNK